MHVLPNRGKEDRMALDAGFVAGVLEGIEGTLEEVIERVVDVLQSRVTALRVSIEPGERRADAKRCEEAVAVER
jgi:hypothetical protein